MTDKEEAFLVNWLQYEDPGTPLECTTQVRLPLVIDVGRLADAGFLKAATIHEIYKTFEENYGYLKGTTRVWLHRLVKWGWLWRPFKGGYRVTDAATKWMDKQLEKQ